MLVLILCGGVGTRLQSIVGDRPKPMAEAKGKPFLEYLIEQLQTQGFTHFVLCVGHLAEHIRDYFGDGHHYGVRIDYAIEAELLGTAGALRNARDFIEGEFLVLNGDSYLEVDFRAMVEFHHSRHSSDARVMGTIATVAVGDAAPYGSLELDDYGRILRFREKAGAGPGRINGGVYVLQQDFLGLIPAGRAVSIEKETFPLALESGCRLYSYPVQGFFVDIGTPDGYRRFQQYVQETPL